MGSQLDLDQGGTFRQMQRTWMGPSVGWVTAAGTVVLPITTAGTTVVLPGNSLITVNVNGAVTIQLPPAKASAAGPQAVPGSFLFTPITIIDIGGFAAAHPITILPASGELIDGFNSIQITVAYGGIFLDPNLVIGGWVATMSGGVISGGGGGGGTSVTISDTPPPNPTKRQFRWRATPAFGISPRKTLDNAAAVWVLA